MEWQRYAIFNDLPNFFNGNFYYLTPGALFFGDLLLGSLPVYIVAAWILGPAGGFNVMYISLFVFNGWAMHLLVRRITDSWAAGMVAGTVFSFAILPQLFIPNHQLLMAWWTPLMLWFLFGALKENPGKNFLGATMSLFLQFATSIYWGFFAAWIFLLFLLISLLWGRFENGRFGAIRSLSVGGLPALVLSALLGFGYLQFYLSWSAIRRIDETVNQSGVLPEYLSSWGGGWWIRSAFWTDAVSHPPYFVSGLAGAVFAALGLVYVIAKTRQRMAIVLAALIAITCFVLSLGPILHWDGELTDTSLPYEFVFEHIPGVQSLRAVNRWALGAHLGLSMLAGIGFAAIWALAGRFGHWRLLLVPAVAVLLALDVGRPSFSLHHQPEESELKAFLRTLPRDPTIVVPILKNPETKSRYMTWSAESSVLPLLNGYNGYIPPTQEHLAGLVNGLNHTDAPRIYAALHALGVRTVILNSDEMHKGSPEAWTRALADLPVAGSRTDVGRFVVLRLGDHGFASPVSSWDSISGRVFLGDLAAGRELVAPLNLLNANAAPWLSPVPQGTYELDVRWEPSSGAAPLTRVAQFQPPPVIQAMGAVAVPVRLSAPDAPGAYRLVLGFEGFELAEATVTVRPPETFDAPVWNPVLDTQVQVLDLTQTVVSGESARIVASATNLGSERWDGHFRLGYSWVFESGPSPSSAPQQLEDRLFIDLDGFSRWDPVVPGSAYTFAGPIDTPTHPGRYSLTIGMVKEGVAWFDDKVSFDVEIVERDGA
ncbi:MAG: hypothetical protein OXG79_13780 [Chloroflexi bacterium]|nr:hypothetical protein [Chloroflexota bacterium]